MYGVIDGKFSLRSGCTVEKGVVTSQLSLIIPTVEEGRGLELFQEMGIEYASIFETRTVFVVLPVGHIHFLLSFSSTVESIF